MIETLGDLFELTNSVVYLAEPIFEDWASELEVFGEMLSCPPTQPFLIANSTASTPIVVSRMLSYYEMLLVIGILFVVINEDAHLSLLEIVLVSGSHQPNS